MVHRQWMCIRLPCLRRVRASAVLTSGPDFWAPDFLSYRNAPNQIQALQEKIVIVKKRFKGRAARFTPSSFLLEDYVRRSHGEDPLDPLGHFSGLGPDISSWIWAEKTYRRVLHCSDWLFPEEFDQNVIQSGSKRRTSEMEKSCHISTWVIWMSHGISEPWIFFLIFVHSCRSWEIPVVPKVPKQIDVALRRDLNKNAETKSGQLCFFWPNTRVFSALEAPAATIVWPFAWPLGVPSSQRTGQPAFHIRPAPVGH